jgi:hypothetical protein
VAKAEKERAAAADMEVVSSEDEAEATGKYYLLILVFFSFIHKHIHTYTHTYTHAWTGLDESAEEARRLQEQEESTMMAARVGRGNVNLKVGDMISFKPRVSVCVCVCVFLFFFLLLA